MTAPTTGAEVLPPGATPCTEAACEVLADVRIRLAQEDAAAAAAQQQRRRKTPA